jgi:hypothetical protein
MSDDQDLLRPPAVQAATYARLLCRSCESLLGICAGLMADQVLNDEEIRYLDLWLRDNEPLAQSWPGEAVYARVRGVLTDGKIAEEEREHLKQTLSALIGGTLRETGAAIGGSTELPIQEVASIQIPKKTFCFTGTFLFGTRAACERAVERVVRGLDYLVIGALTTRSWAHTSFGRRIEKALEYQKAGEHVKIIGERQWESGIRSSIV